MMNERAEAEAWAEEQFGAAALGDSRRTARLVRVAARAAESPSGKLSEVFASKRELDAAYDFIEREQTKVEQLEQAVGRATSLQCVRSGRVRIAVDGSSTNVVDRTGEKGVGRIGSDAAGARGLKVINALAVDAQGTTIGLLAQSWWARPKAPSRSRKQKRKERRLKKPDEKETRYWLEAIERSAERLEEVGGLGWFQRTLGRRCSRCRRPGTGLRCARRGIG
jgi:K+-sensing histidine kinase KdpD